MDSFVICQFSYCPIVWMFHSRKLIAYILHESSLRVVYIDSDSSFEELLRLESSTILHQLNIQKLMTEIITVNPLSAKLIKWPNPLKQFIDNLPTNCLSVFGHFVGLTLKGLKRVLKTIEAYFLGFFSNDPYCTPQICVQSKFIPR